MRRNILSIVGFCVIGAGLLVSMPSHAVAADHKPPKSAVAQAQTRPARQGQAIERLKADAKTKLQALRGEAKSDGKDQVREKVKAIIKDAREQILAVLTPEQKAQLKEMKDKFQEKRQANGDQGKGNA